MTSPKDRTALVHVWPALTLVAAVAALYGPATGRYFTSEDFLLLRVLRERPPWQDVLGTLAAPWLGVTIVKFYRPVATTIFALEGVWFGANPLPFNLVHVAVHVADAFLVAALAYRLQKRFLVGTPDVRASWLAALLFAVYPLHPNAVLFAASFATVFATFFLLASAVLYCRYREPLVPVWFQRSRTEHAERGSAPRVLLGLSGRYVGLSGAPTLPGMLSPGTRA